MIKNTTTVKMIMRMNMMKDKNMNNNANKNMDINSRKNFCRILTALSILHI